MPQATPEKINAKGPQSRTMEVRAANADTRTVELAFSSEAEVERWWGVEILSHEPGSIRMDRLNNGAALLLDHNWRDQIGVVESVTIGEDRVGRAVVRFGRSERASEILQDVVDGIRRHVSVGYMVHSTKLVEERDGTDVYRVTDWEPIEISIVSVPADITVGVGRELENVHVADDAAAAETETTTEGARAMPDQTPPAAQAAQAPAPSGGDTRNHAKLIAEMGEKYGKTDIAARAIREGKSVEDFQGMLIEDMNSRAAKPLGEQFRGQETGLSDKEVRQFSFVKLIRAQLDPNDRTFQKDAAFELEACRAAADKANKEKVRGIVVPLEVLTAPIAGHGSRAWSPFNTGTSGTNTGDTGGNLVATTLQAASFIDILRNRAVAMRLARTLGGLVGNLDIPRQATAGTASWIGEDADAPATSQTIDQIALSPKTVAAYTEVTRRLIMQSSLDVEAMVRTDLATGMALAIDKAAFYGTGNTNQPRGIVNYNGINAVDFGGTGGADAGGAGNSKPTFAELVQMETEIAADNADVNSMAYVFNARMRGHLKTTTKFGAGTDATIWEPGNTVNGYRTEITNQIDNDDVIFGNFADLLVGMWGGIEINVDPYTHSLKGRIRVVTFQDVDFVLRRLQSFCLGRDSG